MGFPIADMAISALDTFIPGNPVSDFFGKIGRGIKKFWNGLVGSGVYDVGRDIYNIYQQQLQNERTMSLQRELFERDDNSLSRLMKQYQDNGINPLLAIPGISQSNTKGFETSALQSENEMFSKYMAREQFNLQQERQKLELDIMKHQDNRAQQEHNSKIKTESLERRILNSKLNGALAYANVYGEGLGVDFGEDGYIPPFAMGNYEKVISVLLPYLQKLVNGPELPKANIPDVVKNDPAVEQTNPILNPYKFKYNGKTFTYDPQTNKYVYDGKSYNELMTVKNLIDYSYEQKREQKKAKQKKRYDDLFFDDSYYEPMWKSQ